MTFESRSIAIAAINIYVLLSDCNKSKFMFLISYDMTGVSK